eukprot:TRINITY_DN8926_c0_g1_i7.p1 TRINITY_DN8926_c0_g1~~TRINITY_DN8926_c0_g1_i7.p1  ORF type:complete len:177 (-),score=33.57 TRINITY_DN8926_c0_g1_i7:629-1159(-)
MSYECDYVFKIVLIGDSGVGKSCLLSRLTDQSFSEGFLSTIGVDLKIKTVERSGKIIKLQMWDTAGQERFRCITQSYFRGAQGILLCFDLTNRSSFVSARRWHDDVMATGPKNLNWLLVGTKTDLSSSRVVTKEEGQNLADEFGIPYMEVSSKSQDKVEDALELLVGDTLKTHLQK